MGQSWPRERLSWPAGMNRSRPLPTVVCMYVCIKKGLCMGWGGASLQRFALPWTSIWIFANHQTRPGLHQEYSGRYQTYYCVENRVSKEVGWQKQSTRCTPRNSTQSHPQFALFPRRRPMHNRNHRSTTAIPRSKADPTISFPPQRASNPPNSFPSLFFSFFFFLFFFSFLPSFLFFFLPLDREIFFFFSSFGDQQSYLPPLRFWGFCKPSPPSPHTRPQTFPQPSPTHTQQETNPPPHGTGKWLAGTCMNDTREIEIFETRTQCCM